MNNIKNRGFTLIELLVVIVIIGILVAMALPNFIKVKDKAKEAQAKSALRVIQVALERYGTDWNGLYPWFLGGGDASYNVVRMAPGNFYWSYMDVEGAFADNINNATGQAGVQDNQPDPGFCTDSLLPAAGDDYGSLPVCMDALMVNGYLSQYPNNPFKKFSKQSCYGQGHTCGSYFSWMGMGGNLMMDVSNTRGDWPWVSTWANEDTNSDFSIYMQNQMPGHFYYHPIFMDTMSALNHRFALGEPGSSPAQQIVGHAVAGYTLSLLAGLTSPGEDVTDMTPCGWQTGNSVYGTECDFYWWNGWGGAMWHPTGYFSFEPDPRASPAASNGPGGTWVVNALPAGDENPGGSGPDGITDFLATTLASGLDARVKRGN